jgi:hypothetical protein
MSVAFQLICRPQSIQDEELRKDCNLCANRLCWAATFFREGSCVGRKQFQERASTQRSLHCAPPVFLSRPVALMVYMRLSLRRAAHVVVASSEK